MDTKQFIQSFEAVQAASYSVNVRNGFWDARNRIIATGLPGAEVNVLLACLGLVASEVAEAMEAARKHAPSTWSDAKTKDTLVRELAGTVIRIMDIGSRWNLPLAEAIATEINANAARGYMHGGKAA